MTRFAVGTVLLLSFLLGAAGCDGRTLTERLNTWLHRSGLYVSAESAPSTVRMEPGACVTPGPWPAAA